MIHHEVIEKDGHVLDVLINSEQTLRIMVSRKGAEPVSLARKSTDGDWVGFLYRDGDVSKNPAGWNNHSTVMGYYIHRILHETTTYRGHTIHGSAHSFLRHKTFAAPTVEEGRLIYQLSADQFAENEYPFKVDFTLIYELTAAELRITFRFDNREDETAHVSFGLHPGLGVTNLADAEVLLSAGRYIRHLAPDNFLSGETQSLDFPGGPMPFAKSELPGSFLLELAGVPNRVFVVQDPATGRRTTLDFSEAPYLTLWSDGSAFICVEPCWGLPDHHVQRSFEKKLGMETIPPRGTLQRSFQIKPEIFPSIG